MGPRRTTVKSDGGNFVHNFVLCSTTKLSTMIRNDENNDEKVDECIGVSVIVGAISIFFLCIFLPLSFWYIPYNQYAFDHNKFGIVDISKVLTQGRMTHLLTHELITFPSTFQRVVYNDNEDNPNGGGGLTVFTYDGYQITVNLQFWYHDFLCDIFGDCHCVLRGVQEIWLK